MEKLKTSLIETLQLPKRPVPLVANLLQLMRNSGMVETDIQALFTGPAFKIIARSHLLSLAAREAGDTTGILGPLIGVSRSPDETREILTKIGNELLQFLEQSGLKDQVLGVLRGGITNDIKVFLTIDELVGQAVNTIRQVAVDRGIANPKLNNMTLEAFDFWLKNRLVLKKLEQETGKNPIELLRFQQVYHTDVRGRRILANVIQEPIIPLIDRTLLLTILPPELNRLINQEPPQINTPLGFLARLNMAGNPVFRLLVQTVRSHLERQPMREWTARLP